MKTTKCSLLFTCCLIDWMRKTRLIFFSCLRNRNGFFFLRILFLPLCFLLSFTAGVPVFSQQMILETDKTEYEYGETIEVRVSIFNDTDSTLYYTASGGKGGTYIGVNSVQFQTVQDGMGWEYEFEAGYTYSWIWELDPAKHGVPDKDGKQVIHGQINGSFQNARLSKRKDSLFFRRDRTQSFGNLQAYPVAHTCIALPLMM